MATILVVRKSGSSTTHKLSGPLEIGRGPKDQYPRLVVDDPGVSWNQLRISEIEGGRIRLENLSEHVPIKLGNGGLLAVKDVRLFPIPIHLAVSGTMIHIELDEPIPPFVPPHRGSIDRGSDEFDQEELRSIVQPVEESSFFEPSKGETPSSEQLTLWLQTLVTIQRSAASSPAFYAETAQALVDLIGLDYGLVLLRRDNKWVEAGQSGKNPGNSKFSRTILEKVFQERLTFYQVLTSAHSTKSVTIGSAVVASPVFGSDHREVVGAVYAVRGPKPGWIIPAIQPLEAQLVQVLAATVSAGLTRIETEDREARRHRQFMDFFSPELARALDLNPQLLQGEEREVTILFSDIRGFSKACQKLTAEETCELIRDVMDRLTQCIQKYQGVVVDYIGDAILALWNAPTDQPNHATLACRAALAMQAEVPGLCDSWRERIGGKLGIGIGLNTGKVLVGNTGSRTRFKYGPIGHEANLASRVEGATKQLGIPVLITGSTHAALGKHDLAVRRLSKVEFVGMAGNHVDLYELNGSLVDPAWTARRKLYEKGLREFEALNLSSACRVLYPLLEGFDSQQDLPSLSIVGRSIEQIRNPSPHFSTVWKLETK